MAETAPDPIAEDAASINGVQQLSVEATKLNHHFSQQARHTRWLFRLVLQQPACWAAPNIAVQ